MPKKAPVDRVGGRQDDGPWPADVQEIVEGKAYKRPVVLNDGTEKEMQVNVTAINDILDEDGRPTEGFSVAYQFEDPTL